MNKLEIGMYVRTKYGIGKIDETRVFIGTFEIHLDSNKGRIHNVTDNTYWNTSDDIIGKPSKNPVDLIEVGDYVNGDKVTEMMIRMRDEQGVFGLPDHYKMFVDEIPIKSIVTKEQFEAMEYKVESEVK